MPAEHLVQPMMDHHLSHWKCALPLVLIISIGYSCEPAGQGGDRDQEARALQPIPLKGRLLSDAPAIGRPNRLHLAEGRLWVADRYSDPGLHVLDAETGTLILSVGRRGEGPGDFHRSPTSLHSRTDDDGAVWVWDSSFQRLTRFEPIAPSEYRHEIITLQGGEQVRRLVWLTSGEMIGTAYSAPKRFQIFFRDGEFLHSAQGELLGPPTASTTERLEATAAGIVVQPWPKRGFVIAHVYSSRIEYYDADARLVRLAKVPFPWGPVFDEGPGGELVFNNRRSAYRGCSATEEYLFALYSGRPDSLQERDWAQSAEFVHVFDWEGNLRAVFQLDRDIGVITVDSSGTTLYASSYSDAHIYRFDLPVIGED